jgi:hypothetical protein
MLHRLAFQSRRQCKQAETCHSLNEAPWKIVRLTLGRPRRGLVEAEGRGMNERILLDFGEIMRRPVCPCQTT